MIELDKDELNYNAWNIISPNLKSFYMSLSKKKGKK